jgi:hypothetical protein
MLLAALGRENAEYYEGKTRTKQWTERQKRASENEKASARAQQRGAAVGFHPAPFGYVGLGLLSAGYVLAGMPSPGLLFSFKLPKNLTT